jgi:hypothetical protein
MALSIVQASGSTQDGLTPAVQATGTVTAGNRIVLVVVRGEPRGTVSTAFVAGDCTDTGTSTLGTITLDHVAEVLDTDSPGLWMQVAIFSAEITVGGSLTLTVVSPTPTDTAYWVVGYVELHDSGGAVAVGGVAAATGYSTSPDSGTVTPGAYEAQIVGGLAVSGHANPDTITPDGAYTTVKEEEDGTAHMCGSISRLTTALPSGSDNASWTLANSRAWAAAAVAYTGTSAGTLLTPAAGPATLTGTSLRMGFTVNMPDEL